MRLNLPVVDREFTWPHGQTLVSVTDLKGRIVHCNAAFVHVSGYEREELLGQPHNLIRHPDMPEEAFRDLWNMISSGRPWSGAVKNRRKDGRFYWVMANVTPILEGDVPSGYLSVRTHLSADAAQQAEALYAVMRDEKDSGALKHRLSAGRLHVRGWRGRWQRWSRPGLGARLAVLAATLAAGAFGAGLWAGGAGTSGAATAAAVATALAAALATWWLRALALRPIARDPVLQPHGRRQARASAR